MADRKAVEAELECVPAWLDVATFAPAERREECRRLITELEGRGLVVSDELRARVRVALAAGAGLSAQWGAGIEPFVDELALAGLVPSHEYARAYLNDIVNGIEALCSLVTGVGRLGELWERVDEAGDARPTQP